jgi:hypothetical protein
MNACGAGGKPWTVQSHGPKIENLLFYNGQGPSLVFDRDSVHNES